MSLSLSQLLRKYDEGQPMKNDDNVSTIAIGSPRNNGNNNHNNNNNYNINIDENNNENKVIVKNDKNENSDDIEPATVNSPVQTEENNKDDTNDEKVNYTAENDKASFKHDAVPVPIETEKIGTTALRRRTAKINQLPHYSIHEKKSARKTVLFAAKLNESSNRVYSPDYNSDNHSESEIEERVQPETVPHPPLTAATTATVSKRERSSTTRRGKQDIPDDLRVTIYWAIRTTIDEHSGTLLPLRGEFERVARLYDVATASVLRIWQQGQYSLLEQVLQLAATNANLIPRSTTTTTTMDSTIQTAPAPTITSTIKITVLSRTKSREERDKIVDPRVSGIVTTKAISVAATKLQLQPDVRSKRSNCGGHNKIHDVMDIKERIDQLPEKKKRGRPLGQIAAAIDISKSQLHRLIKLNLHIDTFKALDRPRQSENTKLTKKKKTTTTKDEENSVEGDDDNDDDADDERENDDDENNNTDIVDGKGTKKKKGKGSNNNSSKLAGKRKRKRKTQLDDNDNDDKDASSPRKKKRTKGEGKKSDEKRSRNVNMQLNTADLDPDKVEMIRRYESENEAMADLSGFLKPRRRNVDTTAADKEAIWIVLQSKYDPAKKELPRGEISRVARRFNICVTLVSRIWTHGQESMKTQLKELEAAAAAGDPQAAATLAAGGRNIRPVFTNRRANCGSKSKYDLTKISEMLDAIPVNERKSLRQTAKILGMSNSQLHRIIQKHNPAGTRATIKDTEGRTAHHQQSRQKSKTSKSNNKTTGRKKTSSTTTVRTENPTATQPLIPYDNDNTTGTAVGGRPNIQSLNNDGGLIGNHHGGQEDDSIESAAIGGMSSTSHHHHQSWRPETNESYWY